MVRTSETMRLTEMDRVVKASAQARYERGAYTSIESSSSFYSPTSLSVLRSNASRFCF